MVAQQPPNLLGVGSNPTERVVSLCDSYLEHRVKYPGNVVQFYTCAG